MPFPQPGAMLFPLGLLHPFRSGKLTRLTKQLLSGIILQVRNCVDQFLIIDSLVLMLMVKHPLSPKLPGTCSRLDMDGARRGREKMAKVGRFQAFPRWWTVPTGSMLHDKWLGYNLDTCIYTYIYIIHIYAAFIHNASAKNQGFSIFSIYIPIQTNRFSSKQLRRVNFYIQCRYWYCTRM